MCQAGEGGAKHGDSRGESRLKGSLRFNVVGRSPWPCAERGGEEFARTDEADDPTARLVGHHRQKIRAGFAKRGGGNHAGVRLRNGDGIFRHDRRDGRFKGALAAWARMMSASVTTPANFTPSQET